MATRVKNFKLYFQDSEGVMRTPDPRSYEEILGRGKPVDVKGTFEIVEAEDTDVAQKNMTMTMISTPESPTMSSFQIKHGDDVMTPEQRPQDPAILPQGTPHCVARGIFSWCSTERKTNRYGAFYPVAQDYLNRVTVPVFSDHSLDGNRVRLFAIVVETRDSGHIGDKYLRIKPSRPLVGEQIELGVGTLRVEPSGDASNPWQFALVPDDGRAQLWMDPRALYRLHDQTVGVYAIGVV